MSLQIFIFSSFPSVNNLISLEVILSQLFSFLLLQQWFMCEANATNIVEPRLENAMSLLTD
jgi:hypothetical protein